MDFDSLKELALDLLFPRICLACQKEGKELCTACLKKILLKAPQCLICGARKLDGKICDYCRTKTHLSRFFAVGDYDDPILRESIHFLKYRKITALAEPLGQLVINYWHTYIKELPRKLDVMIPIPLHPQRERFRSFNQSGMISRQVEGSIGIPLDTQNLTRIKNTAAQINLEDPHARRENVKNAFALKRPLEIKDKTILLFDDVATTGSTLNEAARVLKEAGARSVWAFVLAH